MSFTLRTARIGALALATTLAVTDATAIGQANITFTLIRLEAKPGTPGALRGIGTLRVAGVEKEIALDITTERKDATLAVKGEVQVLMTDFGITPPKAMMGTHAQLAKGIRVQLSTYLSSRRHPET